MSRRANHTQSLNVASTRVGAPVWGRKACDGLLLGLLLIGRSAPGTT